MIFYLVTESYLKPGGVLVLVITYLGGQFGINYPSVFLKVLKLAKWNKGNFKVFKNHEGHLFQKSPDQTFRYWLIRSNQKRLCIETNISEQRTITNQRAGNYKTAENYKKTPSTVQTTVWLSEKSMMDLFYEIVNGLWNLFSGKIQQLSAINYFCKKLYFRYWQDYYCGYLFTNLCELNFRKGKIWWCIIC